MNSEIVNIESDNNFFALAPVAMLKQATAIAEVLADVIKKQKLSTTIAGKEYVRYEGWNLMGAMLGYLPGEDEVKRLSDGSYEAHVTLYNVHTGLPLGKGSSSLCSVKESRWGKVDDFARRSMAITRAAGKAYRISFGWIIALAGYETTPEEEMPEDLKSRAPSPSKGSNPLFDDKNQTHRDMLREAFHHYNITNNAVMHKLGREFVGQPMNEINLFLEAAISEGRADP